MTKKTEGDGIASGVGVATRSTGVKIGSTIELAMADAVKQVSLDSEAIWADDKLSLEEKNAKIAAINAPEAIRDRMMDARQAVKDSLSAQADKDANAPAAQ